MSTKIIVLKTKKGTKRVLNHPDAERLVREGKAKWLLPINEEAVPHDEVFKKDLKTSLLLFVPVGILLVVSLLALAQKYLVK